MKTYLDMETCGLHSMPVLLQYAGDDGPIHLVDLWKQPIRDTLRLLERIADTTVVGFNLSFDWFHVVKAYTIFRLCPLDWIPEQHIEEIARCEGRGQDGPCIKPAGSLDLLLHSRKGPYQSLMARSDICIRKVPSVLAPALAMELERRVELDGIYFAKSANREAPRWKVFDRKGTVEFKDVVLKFHPSGGLKFLAEYALGLKPKYHYADVEPLKAWFPVEYGFAPTAAAVSSADKQWEVWGADDKGQPKLVGHAWPGVIGRFIEHWATRQDAREYATDDIVYTRKLDEHFGYPAPNDDDSVLSCMVPVVRWHGLTIDRAAMQKQRDEAQAVVDASPVNVNRPSEIRRYLGEVMDDLEFINIEQTTNKKKLKVISKWTVKEAEECGKCQGSGCARCGGSGTLAPADLKLPETTSRYVELRGNHPAALRAAEILAARVARKEVETFDKLLLAGKFHPDFSVIGTLSSRMSGGSGLNAQGIKKGKRVRSLFPLAWVGFVLSGGDFDSFEVTIADAVFGDDRLRADLLSGKKIHALFAMELYPGTTYEECLNDEKKYNDGKTGIFGMMYGGDWATLMRNLSIEELFAKQAYNGFLTRYSGIRKNREGVARFFGSMSQPGGEGTAVVWIDPADHCETFLGFRRYFTLENRICKALFDLASNPPAQWKNCQIRVMRRVGRVQTAGGAVSSALYGAAFGIQGQNQRAAGNHLIQSPGAQITKAAQRRLWDLQPAGVHELVVAPMNIHDEIMCVHHPDYTDRIVASIREVVESYRPQVPLIGMSWMKHIPSWAGKKAAGPDDHSQVKIRRPEMMEFD